MKVQFRNPGVGKACMAIFYPTPDLKGEPSSSGFSTDGLSFLPPEYPTAEC